MNRYLALFRARANALLQYRAAAIAGLFTQLFWGLIYTMVLSAFYREGSQYVSISLETAITFVWINQAFWLLVPWNVDKQVEAQISSGQIAYELIRPLDLYWLWLWRCLAIRTIPTIMRSLPIFVIAGLFLGLQAPVSWQALCCFIGSVCFSTFLSASITTLVLISLFWTLSGEGILRLLPPIAVFLSGLVVPLPLFPDWLQPFMLVQPFRAIVDIPCRLYIGIIDAGAFGYYAAIQIGWTLFFITLGKMLMHRAMKKVVIQGG
jgi:ABC-2 type transport system permease protein